MVSNVAVWQLRCERERERGRGGGTSRSESQHQLTYMQQGSSCIVILLHSLIQQLADTCIKEGSNFKMLFFFSEFCITVTCFRYILYNVMEAIPLFLIKYYLWYIIIPLVSQLNGSKVDSSHGSWALQGRWGHSPSITTVLSSFNAALLTPEIHLNSHSYKTGH